MKGQNEHVTNFLENGWTDLEDLGIRRKVWMSYALTMEQILHMAPGVPAPVKIVPKKFLQKSAAICCHCQRRALRVCSFLCLPCTAALSALRGKIGYKISQCYLLVVRCLNLWQQFEFGFPTGSNPAPPNLLKSTLANPVWNTGDRLVSNKSKIQVSATEELNTFKCVFI